MTEPSEVCDTHDASTCDAFPLAVGLAQVQARYAKLEALADKLAEALENCADDLGSEVKARTEHLRGYPTYERKRQADLEPVTKAQRALAAYNLHKIDG